MDDLDTGRKLFSVKMHHEKERMMNGNWTLRETDYKSRLSKAGSTLIPYHK